MNDAHLNTLKAKAKEVSELAKKHAKAAPDYAKEGVDIATKAGKLGFGVVSTAGVAAFNSGLEEYKNLKTQYFSNETAEQSQEDAKEEKTEDATLEETGLTVNDVVAVAYSADNETGIARMREVLRVYPEVSKELLVDSEVWLSEGDDVKKHKTRVSSLYNKVNKERFKS